MRLRIKRNSSRQRGVGERFLVMRATHRLARSEARLIRPRLTELVDSISPRAVYGWRPRDRYTSPPDFRRCTREGVDTGLELMPPRAMPEGRCRCLGLQLRRQAAVKAGTHGTPQLLPRHREPACQSLRKHRDFGTRTDIAASKANVYLTRTFQLGKWPCGSRTFWRRRNRHGDFPPPLLWSNP